jgi:hypothetical protein
MNMFSTYPLTVQGSRLAIWRIISASSRLERIRGAVRAVTMRISERGQSRNRDRLVSTLRPLPV